MTDVSPAPRGPRFAHFHTDAIHTDDSGMTHVGKGRLLATIATKELPDGTIAVGVSRCNPSDMPVRLIGRKIAQARLDRLVAYLNKQELTPSQTVLQDAERAELLSFRMDRDTFLRRVIQEGAIKQLAQADDADEALRLSNDLRKSVL
mgnify:CR=1 FL=1